MSVRQRFSIIKASDEWARLWARQCDVTRYDVASQLIAARRHRHVWDVCARDGLPKCFVERKRDIDFALYGMLRWIVNALDQEYLRISLYTMFCRRFEGCDCENIQGIVVFE